MSGTTSNILATLFFGLAFLWFLVAVLYACSVVLFLRMRREGRLLNVSMDDPAFGRYYFCGDRFYLPMGWIFRRFVLQYRNEQRRKQNNGRVMTKSERRRAMEVLLDNLKVDSKVNESMNTSTSESETSEKDEELGAPPEEQLESNLAMPSSEDPDENVCSICLGPYSSEYSAWKSSVCNHQFHRKCLLAWLQQPGKTECPCCREAFVEEDDVWKTVKRLRKIKANNSPKNTILSDPRPAKDADGAEAEGSSSDTTSDEV